MPQDPKKPFQDSHLDSPEYRERLMRKLNCLIAVLEVAHAKVRRSLQGPASDPQRLEKIQNNLSSTLEVCRRARRALERREALPSDLPQNLAQVVRQTDIARQARRDVKLPEGSRYEMSSAEEHARFQAMGTISEDEIGSCDLDELSRQLLG